MAVAVCPDDERLNNLGVIFPNFSFVTLVGLAGTDGPKLTKEVKTSKGTCHFTRMPDGQDLYEVSTSAVSSISSLLKSLGHSIHTFLSQPVLLIVELFSVN
ncbi:unnamed protein product [Sphenostylis stenocarpa]|uniref:Uncharacterized protein n=1 Tax=Sphenostylis stenocarpa TaxID=92480 RepID=A0AA86VXW8_9FABA|nr:unnamed protein product [Sphenostylis stenocarpa]